MTTMPETAGRRPRRRSFFHAALAAFVLAACGADDSVQTAEPSVGKVFFGYQSGGGPAFFTGTLFKVAPQTFITNNHVIETEGGARIIESFARFRTAAGEVVDHEFTIAATDPRKDLALLRLNSDTAASPLPIYEGEVQPGMRVGALGFPGVNESNVVIAGDDLEPIYSSRGEVNNIAPRIMGGASRATEAIQHDAIIARGSSGGPLLTLCAAVLGVNTQTPGAEPGDAMGDIEQDEFRQSSSHNELAEFLRENNVAFSTDSRSCQPGAGVPMALIALGVAVAGLGGALGLMWLRFRPLLRQLRDAADRIMHPGADMQEFVLQSGATRIPVSFRPGKPRAYKFGRDPARVDIKLDDEFVSREHFEIGYENGARIRDLNSTNGTNVNGQPCGADWRTLAAGDRITVGGFEFELVKV
jgi:hypothetical protein